MERNIRIDGKNHFLTSDDVYLDAMGSNFEPHMVDLFKALIRPGDTVLDIGANIGLTGILFSGLAKKVLAFEPGRSTFGILQENLSRARAAHVETFNLGLGDRAGTLDLTYVPNNRAGGYISDQARRTEGHVTEQIQIETLDNLWAARPERIDFMKIDVEGFEANVIKGGAAVIEKYKPIVTLELNHFCLNAFRRTSVPEFFDFLRSIFPYLYAVDGDNTSIANLHDENQAYYVMHTHIVHFRYPNIVAGFDTSVWEKLEALRASARQKADTPAPALANTPEIADASGRVAAIKPPLQAVRGEAFHIDVEVFNESLNTWHTQGAKPVRLSYHWRDLSGNSILFDGERTEMDVEQLQAGANIRARMKVVPPNRDGKLILLLTIVQDGVSWLEDRGLQAHAIEMSIMPPTIDRSF